MLVIVGALLGVVLGVVLHWRLTKVDSDYNTKTKEVIDVVIDKITPAYMAFHSVGNVEDGGFIDLIYRKEISRDDLGRLLADTREPIDYSIEALNDLTNWYSGNKSNWVYLPFD